MLETVYVELTRACNLRCAHCYLSCTPERGGASARTLREDLQIVDAIADQRVPRVAFTGGEPLLCEHLHEVVRHASRRGLSVLILTNGTLITPETARLFARVGCRVQLSIDGVGASHDRVRGRGAFERLERGIEILEDAGVRPHMRFTLNRLNSDSYMEAVEYCKEKGLWISFALVTEIGRARRARLDIAPSRYFQIVEDLYRLKRSEHPRLTLPSFSIEDHLDGRPQKVPCTAATKIAVITAANEFLPCPFLANCGLPDVTYERTSIARHASLPVFRVARKLKSEDRSCFVRRVINGEDPYSLRAYREWGAALHGLGGAGDVNVTARAQAPVDVEPPSHACALPAGVMAHRVERT